jgi:hypothetical protein
LAAPVFDYSIMQFVRPDFAADEFLALGAIKVGRLSSPQQVDSLIVTLKREKPHWGARKIRELLLRRPASDVRVPAKS